MSKRPKTGPNGSKRGAVTPGRLQGKYFKSINQKQMSFEINGLAHEPEREREREMGIICVVHLGTPLPCSTIDYLKKKQKTHDHRGMCATNG